MWCLCVRINVPHVMREEITGLFQTENPSESGSRPQEKQQHLYKVLVIGDYAVGKTSIIRRYTEGYFTPNYKLTIGVDFALKGSYAFQKSSIQSNCGNAHTSG